MLLALVIMAAPGLVLASGLSYDYVDGGYVKIKPDEGDIEADGLAVGLSRSLNEGMFLTLGLSRVETDELVIPDINAFLDDFVGTLVSTSISGAINFHRALNGHTDLTYGGGLVLALLEGDGQFGDAVDDDDVGFSANLGLRTMLGDTVEGRAGLGYLGIFEESETSFLGGLIFHVNERFAIKTEVELGDESKAYVLGVYIGLGH